jgi:hypothetical protein
MTDSAESRLMAHRFVDGASPPTPEWRLQQQADEQAVMQTETNVDADVRNRMLSDYGPRVLSVLDRIHARGEASFGVSNAEIQDATFMCSSVSATNQLRLCISQLGGYCAKDALMWTGCTFRPSFGLSGGVPAREKPPRSSFAFSCRPFGFDLDSPLTAVCILAETAPLPILRALTQRAGPDCDERIAAFRHAGDNRERCNSVIDLRHPPKAPSVQRGRH